MLVNIIIMNDLEDLIYNYFSTNPIIIHDHLLNKN